MECNNYRGIGLLTVVGKVFVRAQNGRMKTMMKDSVKEASEVVEGVVTRSLQSDR